MLPRNYDKSMRGRLQAAFAAALFAHAFSFFFVVPLMKGAPFFSYEKNFVTPFAFLDILFGLFVFLRAKKVEEQNENNRNAAANKRYCGSKIFSDHNMMKLSGTIFMEHLALFVASTYKIYRAHSPFDSNMHLMLQACDAIVCFTSVYVWHSSVHAMYSQTGPRVPVVPHTAHTSAAAA